MCFSSDLVRRVGARMAAGNAASSPVSPHVRSIVESKTDREIAEALTGASINTRKRHADH